MTIDEQLSQFARDAEQAEAALTMMAGLASTYFVALLENGFAREEALVLTRDWVTWMVAKKPNQGAAAND